MNHWSGTARRLFFAFAALLVFFGAASWWALAGLDQLHTSLHILEDEERAVRAALQTSAALRDQYAWQILRRGEQDAARQGAEARARIVALSRRLEKMLPAEADQSAIRDIVRASDALEQLARTPSIDEPELRRNADEAMALGQSQVDALSGRLGDSIEGFAARADDVQHDSFRWSLALVLAAIAFAAGVGVYIVRSIGRPVARLGAGAARIAEGELSTRIDIDSPDEFGRLAAQFNAMTAALREHQQKLVDAEKLAGLGRVAAGVAHEINNPLGVILGYVKLLRRKAEGQLAEDLAVIEEEATRCQAIVDGMRELSRQAPLVREPVALGALAAEVVERVRAALGSNVRIRVEGEARAEGDPAQLRQVLANLVRNAIEAAGPGGEVAVETSSPNGAAVLTVRDSGAGLSDESRARLFEPFFTTKATGTGLGLALSQSIARAHGGSIAAENAPGGGARFTLTLPAGAAERAA